MALVYAFTRDPGTFSFVRQTLADVHDVAAARSWPRLATALRERPVSLCVIDLSDIRISPGNGAESPRGRAESTRGRHEWHGGRGGWDGGREELMALRRRFPSVPFVILESGSVEPRRLLDLGRLGFRSLVLMGYEGRDGGLRRNVEREWEATVASKVLRAVSAKLPSREAKFLAVALDQVHQCWSAEVLAERLGLSRPFLSVLLKRAGLPSAGRLLVWVRLLHAAEWLGDPGRTGQSVSRQLEYSSGAAFRRVLKSYAGATPTDVVARGGMPFVLGHFLRETGFDRAVARHVSVA